MTTLKLMMLNEQTFAQMRVATETKIGGFTPEEKALQTFVAKLFKMQLLQGFSLFQDDAQFQTCAEIYANGIVADQTQALCAKIKTSGAAGWVQALLVPQLESADSKSPEKVEKKSS